MKNLSNYLLRNIQNCCVLNLDKTFRNKVSPLVPWAWFLLATFIYQLLLLLLPGVLTHPKAALKEGDL